MSKALSEIFIETQGKPFEHEGKLVSMGFTASVSKGQQVTLELISANSELEQGIEVSVDSRKGEVEFSEGKVKRPIFWTNFAPDQIPFVCYPKKQDGILRIWNVWCYPGEKEPNAWINNAGIVIEPISDSESILHCSNGYGDVDFSNLVFRVTIQS
ncbi:hypothetical protein CBW65_11755 [Tumebacillus avium]|uniref:Uncharacterized protein n=1 Tax=Tumebacillus avium TaxID=1903704 RepID=A0A1Y0IM77_9BACL|nr:hypothetical protein [Tumebacillus avium]ARU61611.1 hypothetical protein CBW65_11755 [Tumebacillus avium]